MIDKMIADYRNRKVERKQLPTIFGAGAKSVGAVRKGAMNESLACGYLLANGYDVFRNQSSQGPADLVAIKLEESDRLYIDVKSSSFSVQTVNGRETLDRAKELGITIMVISDTGDIEWINGSPKGKKETEVIEPVYSSADEYARSVS